MDPVLAALEFESPLRLLWLAVAPLVVYFAFRSWALASARRRIASLVCRLLVLALAVIALAGLVHRGSSRQRMVVFATDVSRSAAGSQAVAAQFLAAAGREPGEHRAAFLAFADRPGPLSEQPQPGGETLAVAASNPAAAVQLAAAAIPAEYVPGVVLLSDGLQTQGDLAQAALGSGVPVAVLPLPAFADTEVCVSELLAPAEAVPGGDVLLEVVIGANREMTATLELLCDGGLAARSELALQVGENRTRLLVPWVGAPTAQAVIFTARVTAEHDTIGENNQRRAKVFAARRTQVLLVAPQPAAADALADVLRRQGIEVAVQRPAQLAADADALDAFDALLLGEVAASDFTTAQLAATSRYVHDLGGGLIVTGGEQTFGEAAYRDTLLERLLPVTAAVATETEKAVLAMVLVIDRSGSMEEERRLDLAKEAARQSVRVLEAHDKAGVVAFSDDAEWIAPLARVADTSDLLRRIDTLTAYGQTNMYQGVMRGVLALEQTVADRRHMILLTDGIPSPGDYREIAQRMAVGGITLSTVSISAGAEQDMLRAMADIARGRHHHCNDPSDVPRILVQETQVVAADETHREFRPFALRTLPGLEIASAPPLDAYARTNPKPEAEPLLFAVGGHPLLCWWRHGAGVALALTSAVDNRQAAPWHTWPGYGAFWERLVRHVARPPAASPLSLAARRTGDAIAVSVNWIGSDDHEVTSGKLTAKIAGPGGESRSLDLPPVAPGCYAATFPASADEPAEYEIRVASEDGGGAVVRTVFLDYPEELRLREADETLLRHVAETTGGVFQPDPASIFAPDGRTVARVIPLWPYLLTAALLLFVADVALRRLRF